MKANELMIGDWVLYATRPMKIDGISVGGGSAHSDSENWVAITDIAPVPLTSEILEKNGMLQWTGGGDSTKMLRTPYGCEGTRYSIYIGLQKKTIDIHCAPPIERTPGWRKHNKVYLENCGCYVHELQHALRLCGIEKEIEL